MEVPKFLGVDLFPDPVGHFGAPWWPFLIFEVLIEGVLGSKTYLAKVDGSTQKPRGKHLSRPCHPILGPLAAILDFAGGAVLQALRRCRR